MSNDCDKLCSICELQPQPRPPNCRGCRYLGAVRKGIITSTQLGLIPEVFRFNFVDDASKTFREKNFDVYLKAIGEEAQGVCVKSPEGVMKPIYELYSELEGLQDEIHMLDKQIELLKVQDKKYDLFLAELAVNVDSRVNHLIRSVNSLADTLDHTSLGTKTKQQKTKKKDWKDWKAAMKRTHKKPKTSHPTDEVMNSNLQPSKPTRTSNQSKNLGTDTPVLQLSFTEYEFGEIGTLYIDELEIGWVSNLACIGTVVVASYILFLHRDFAEKIKANDICFIWPCKTHFLDKEEQIVWLTSRLSGCKNKLILVPHNTGVHWVLAVIDRTNKVCYYLDSLPHAQIDPAVKEMIDGAIEECSSSSGTSPQLSWVMCKCPKQEGGFECGYYIMKFMKEIVIGGVDILLKENVVGNDNKYERGHLEEVQKEWLGYITSMAISK